MRLSAVLVLMISILISCEKSGVTQQQGASPSLSVGEKAVNAVLKHYSLNPLALDPATGKALPTDGAWSIGKTAPTSCPQSTQLCVEVFYRVPTTAVQCSWVVLLNADGTDGTFIDENDAAPRYLLRKLSQSEAGSLIQSRSKPSYPPIAMAAHVKGVVVMNAVVDETGHMQKVVVVSGPEMLRTASLDAARKWTFTPTTVGAKTVPYEVQLIFNFKTNGPPIGNVETLP